MLEEDDPLTDFQRREVDLLGETRAVWVSGTGPAVIVLHEMPGISPRVARFARMVRDAGFTAWMPSLFGTDGAVPTASAGARVFQRACISKEFRALVRDQDSPITIWLRALAAHAHAACGGRGCGAVGMCFTGNFALSMMLAPAMRAAVASQPSLPLGDPDGLAMSPGEARAIRQRLVDDDLVVLGLRFAGDPFCTAERFAAYERCLGDRFIGHVLPDSSAAPPSTRPDDFFRKFVPVPHSVLTVHLVDRAGEPTAGARDEVLAYLRRQLHD
jgi:dienelactone hydrolase